MAPMLKVNKNTLKKLTGRFFAFLAVFFITLPSLSAWALNKDSVLWFLEGQILGGYSQIEGTSGLGSIISNWLVSPTVKLDNNLYWINIYNGSYDRMAQVVTQDEGNRQATDIQTHNLSTSFKHRVNDTWSLRPHFFVNWSFLKETEDESFGNGLYDYRDIGGGLESSWITLNTRQQQDEARLGFQFFKREYPNYQSVLFLFDPNGTTEIDEKDFYGYKANLSFDSRSRSGWSWGLETISLYKDYTDKQTIDSNGIRTGDTRQDFAQYVNGYAIYSLCSEFTLRLDGQFVVNVSNLDFYDTHNTLSPADDDFIEKYYDYFIFNFKPSMIYTKNIEKDKNFVASVGYELNVFYYPGRKTQDPQGIYQDKDEQDFTHTFTLQTSYPVTKQIAWVTLLSYTIANSNQEFEQFYTYNYNLWSAVTGVSIKY